LRRLGVEDAAERFRIFLHLGQEVITIEGKSILFYEDGVQDAGLDIIGRNGFHRLFVDDVVRQLRRAADEDIRRIAASPAAFYQLVREARYHCRRDGVLVIIIGAIFGGMVFIDLAVIPHIIVGIVGGIVRVGVDMDAVVAIFDKVDAVDGRRLFVGYEIRKILFSIGRPDAQTILELGV
jgi:hypothetical protein